MTTFCFSLMAFDGDFDGEAVTKITGKDGDIYFAPTLFVSGTFEDAKKEMLETMNVLLKQCRDVIKQ